MPLTKAKFHDWALDKRTDNVKLLVQFYADVDRQTVTRDLATLGLKGQLHGADNSWAVVANRNKIRQLARPETVKFIQQGPMPFLPLNEGGRRIANSDQAQRADWSNPRPAYDGVSGRNVRIGI
ncbi:MAG: hypothetical protein JSU63_04605 [Phycisphaerales bacterium]|nr:MAG: hypothetical protein JSU63_04605 [Phycisphaerales bacterium]